MSTQLGNKEIMAKNIQYYMNLYGKSRNDMCEALGVKYTTFTDWVNGNTYPRIDSIELMANYFGIEKSDLVEARKNPHDPLSGLTNISTPAARAIPILGTICAGSGIWCEENFDGLFFMDSSVKADLCVKVSGDSMKDANILNGDKAFIQKSYDFKEGLIYAVRIDDENEAMLKVVHRDGDKFILSSRNPDYAPIIEDIDNVSIIGECVGVYHAAR